MSEPDALIELLMVPGVHSGTELGDHLGISRVAVKKRIDRLLAEGFPVETISNRGYKIRDGIELLSRSQISRSVQFEDKNQRLKLEIFQVLDSTNTYVDNSAKSHNEVHAVIAESQHMGQGRRGRSWVSSPYQNLMLSVGYLYSSWPENPAAISLAFSVAVHRALVRLGVDHVKLKWPNDLVAKNAKLGGLLVSASGEAGGDLTLILGVGINIHVAADLLASIDQPAIDLAGIGQNEISRNRLAAEIISNTADMLSIYPEVGFKPFANYWNDHALYVGQKVRLFDNDQEFVGELKGVDDQGELCLQQEGGLSTFSKSELSMRPLS